MNMKSGVLAALIAGVLMGCATVDRYAIEDTPGYAMSWYAKNFDRLKTRADVDKHPNSMLSLVEMYANGWGVKKDTAQSQYYLKQLTQTDPQFAKIFLAKAYSNGWRHYGIKGQDYNMTRQMAEEALAMPKSPSIPVNYYLSNITELQGIYLEGKKGIPPNHQRILDLYRLAEPYFAAAGPKSYQAAAIRVYRAVLICQGNDPESQDKEMAREWMRKMNEIKVTNFTKQRLERCA